MNSGLFGFWLPPSPRLRRTGRFGSVTGLFKPAPSPKPRQKPKIPAAHRYIFSVNAPCRSDWMNLVFLKEQKELRAQKGFRIIGALRLKVHSPSYNPKN
jgi:hypothetical protein